MPHFNMTELIIVLCLIIGLPVLVVVGVLRLVLRRGSNTEKRDV